MEMPTRMSQQFNTAAAADDDDWLTARYSEGFVFQVMVRVRVREAQPSISNLRNIDP